MTANEVYEYYGKCWAQVTRELELGKNTSAYWRKIGYIPLHMQLKIEEATGGELVAGIHKD